ncbi:MAG: phytoene synthase [Candidatus Hydrogenedentota bacterium]
MIKPAILESRAIIAHHSKSFSLASALLHKNHRDEVAVVYAWCRRADDAIDLAPQKDHWRVVNDLKAELRAIYAGEQFTDPILAEFQSVVRKYNVPFDYPNELLAGMEMDADGWQYRTMDDLLLYSFRVAGTVGLMMCHVLGVTHPHALPRAAHLGIAMQITNICRDILEDWNRGRLYVPETLLERHGAGGISRGAGRPMTDGHALALGRCVRDLLEEADKYYASADEGLRYLSWRSALGVRTARMVYSSIGTQIARSRWDIQSGRAHVSKAGKLALATKAVSMSVLEFPIRTVHRFRPATITRVFSFPLDILPVRACVAGSLAGMPLESIL